MTKYAHLSLVLAFLTAAVPAFANDWSKTYPLTGLPNLRLETDDGAIKVVSGDVKQVEVHVTAEGWEIGNDVRITESQNGNTIDLAVKIPHQSWHILSFGRRSIVVDVRLPRNADMDLHTGDGDVTVQSVSGRIRVQTGDGKIRYSSLGGEVQMHTGDGSIDGMGFNGTLDAETGDGNISVDGKFEGLRLKTGDGNVEVTAEAGSTSGGGWSIGTGDGRVTLRLPQDFGAELDARTSDGHITVDYPVTSSGQLRSHRLQGKIGNGGGPLQIRTGDGAINIQRR